MLQIWRHSAAGWKIDTKTEQRSVEYVWVQEWSPACTVAPCGMSGRQLSAYGHITQRSTNKSAISRPDPIANWFYLQGKFSTHVAQDLKLIESCKRAVYHILVMIAGHTHRHIEMIGWLRWPSCCEWRWWRQDRAKAHCHCRSAAHWTEQTRQTEGQPDCKCLTRSTPSTAATALSAMRMCASTHPRARLAMSLSQPFTRLGLSRHWLSILHYYIASVSLYIYNIIA